MEKTTNILQWNVDKKGGKLATRSWTRESQMMILVLLILSGSFPRSISIHLLRSLFFLFCFLIGPLSSTILPGLFLAWFSPWQHWKQARCQECSSFSSATYLVFCLTALAASCPQCSSPLLALICFMSLAASCP